MKKIFYALCAVLLALFIGLSNVSAKEVTLDEFVDKFQKEIIDSMDPEFAERGYSLSIKKISDTEVKINEHQDKYEKIEESDHDVYFKYDKNNKSFSYDKTTTTTPATSESLTKFNCSYTAHKIMDYVLLVLGELSGHTEEEVRVFLSSDEALNLTYEKNGIEYSFKKAGELEGYKEFETKKREDLNNDELDFSMIPMLITLKGDLANLFKDVKFSEIKDDEDNEEPEFPEEPSDGEEDNVTDDTEEEEPEENPSTGDSKINLVLITITLVGGLSYIGYRRYKELKD